MGIDMGSEISGLLGILVLIAYIWAIINVLQSQATKLNKVVWTVLVLVLPMLGLILWTILGPKRALEWP